MKQIKDVNFIKGNFLEEKFFEKINDFFDGKIDVIISDMAVNTSGNKNLDSYRTGELCLNAMELSRKLLQTNGIFLSKIFMGSIFEDIKNKATNCFKKVALFKPISSKKESKEIYIFCKGTLNI